MFAGRNKSDQMRTKRLLSVIISMAILVGVICSDSMSFLKFNETASAATLYPATIRTLAKKDLGTGGKNWLTFLDNSSGNTTISSVNEEMWADTSSLDTVRVATSTTELTVSTKASENSVGYQITLDEGFTELPTYSENTVSENTYTLNTTDGLAAASTDDLFYTIEYDRTLGGYYRQYYVSTADQLNILLYYYGVTVGGGRGFTDYLKAQANDVSGNKANKLGIVLLCDLDLGGRYNNSWLNFYNTGVYLDIDGNGYTIYNGYFGSNSYFLGGPKADGITTADNLFYIHDLTFSHMFIGHADGMFYRSVNRAFFSNVDWEYCLAADTSNAASATTIVLGNSYARTYFKECTIRSSYVIGNAHCAMFASYNGDGGSVKLSASNSHNSKGELDANYDKVSEYSTYIGAPNGENNQAFSNTAATVTFNGYYYIDIPESGEYTLVSGSSENALSDIEAVEAQWKGSGNSRAKVYRSGESTEYPLNSVNFPSMYENCATIDCTVYDVGTNHSGTFVSCMQSGIIFKGCFTNSTIYMSTLGGVFIGACIGSGNGFFYPYDSDDDGVDECTFANSVFTQCYASGSVEGTKDVGGFVGAVFDDTRAYARYNVTSATSYRGKVIFDNCYSTSSVGMSYSGSFVGGFAGIVIGNICGDTTLDAEAEQHIFKNCYAAGEVGGITTLTATDSSNTNTIGGFFGSYVNYTDDGKNNTVTSLAAMKVYAVPLPEANKNNTAKLINCYYDMQTTAMRERDIGNANSSSNYYNGTSYPDDKTPLNHTLYYGEGLTGVYTQTCKVKNVLGLTDTVVMGSDLIWTNLAEYYPILKAFYAPDVQYAYSNGTTRADVVNNMHYERQQIYYYYALASTATVFLNHYDEVLSDGTNPDADGNAIPAGKKDTTNDKTVYDTVRDITRKFEFTSVTSNGSIQWRTAVEKNETSGFYDHLGKDSGFSLTWADVTSSHGNITETYHPSVLTISQLDGVYKCLDFAPGKQWVDVTVSDGIYSGSRDFRLLPTAYLNAGGIITVNVGTQDTETYHHRFNVTDAEAAGLTEDDWKAFLTDGYNSEGDYWSEMEDYDPDNEEETGLYFTALDGTVYPYYKYRDDTDGKIYYYYNVTTGSANAETKNEITVYIPDTDGTGYHAEKLSHFTHYVGVAYATTDRKRMDPDTTYNQKTGTSIYGKQELMDWTGQSTTDFQSNTTVFAVYSGYLQNASFSGIGMNSDGTMLNQKYLIKYDDENSALYNSSTNGSTIVRVYQATLNGTELTYNDSDEITDTKTLQKFAGTAAFETKDVGYYYMVYQWRLNDGRYLEDVRLVQISSDEYNVSMVTGILNEEHTVTELQDSDGNISAYTPIDQYVTDDVTTQDGTCTWKGVYRSSEEGFTKDNAASYYDTDSEFSYNTKHIYNNETYHVKSWTKTTGASTVVVGWRRSSEYQLVTLIIETKSATGDWQELATTNGDSLVGEATYSYTYTSYQASQDIETKLYTITETPGVTKTFTISALKKHDISDIEESIVLDFSSGEEGGDISNQTDSFRVTALFTKMEAEVAGEKTVLLNPTGADTLSGTNGTESNTSGNYPVKISLSDQDQPYEVDNTNVTALAKRKAVVAGDTLTYRVKLQNTGYLNAQTVTVTDNVPDGCTYVPDSMKIYAQAKESSSTSATSGYGYVTEVNTSEDGTMTNGYIAAYEEAGRLTWCIPSIDYYMDYYVEYQVIVNDIGAVNVSKLLTNTAQWDYTAEIQSVSHNTGSTDVTDNTNDATDEAESNLITDMVISHSDSDADTSESAVIRTYNISFTISSPSDDVVTGTYAKLNLDYKLPDSFIMSGDAILTKDGGDISYNKSDTGTLVVDISISELAGEYNLTFTGTQYLLGSSYNGSQIREIDMKTGVYCNIYEDPDHQTLSDAYTSIVKWEELITNQVETDVTHLYLTIEKNRMDAAGETLTDNDASQAFLFMIEYFEDDAAVASGMPTETFYMDVTCSDSSGSQIVQVDHRGYYRITEIVSWSDTDYDFYNSQYVSNIRLTNSQSAYYSLRNQLTKAAGSKTGASVWVTLPELTYASGAFPTSIGTLTEYEDFPTALFINCTDIYAYISAQANAKNTLTTVGEPAN